MGMPVAPTFVFPTNGFRFRDSVVDPSSEDAAFDAGDAAAGTDIASWEVDTLLRLRMLLQQTNSAAEAHGDLTGTLVIEYNQNGGGWNAVAAIGTDTDACQFVGGAPLNLASIDSQLIGSGTFLTDGDYLETDPSGVMAFTDLSDGAEEIEVEACIEFPAGQVSDEDTIDIRIGFSTTPANAPTYTDVGRVTINKPPPPTIDQDSFRFYDDGTESGSTVLADVNKEIDIAVDTVFQIRFLIQETAGESLSNQEYQLEYNKNNAGWVDVNATSSNVRSAAGALVEDGKTTQRIG